MTRPVRANAAHLLRLSWQLESPGGVPQTMTVTRFAFMGRVWRYRLRTAAAIMVFAAPAPAARGDDALTSYALTRGWATFGLALPRGVATTALKVGPLPTQTDVKVRWPDGSIRFAVVTANILKDGNYSIIAAPAPAGTQVASAAARASVTLSIGGKPYVATVPAALGDAWLNGPLVHEGRAVVAPGGHPFLRVVFDVRSYAGGGQRLDMTVENCLDAAAADEVTYDAVVTIGDRQVFQQTNIRHKYLARWRKVFAIGSFQQSAVTPNLAPFVASRALPGYLATVGSPPRALTGGGVSGTGFGILAFGDLTVPMNAHSGRPELAPYPDWTAQYLVHKTKSQLAYVIRHGELAGSWGVHVRNVDGSMPTIDAPGHAYYWLDPRWRDPGNLSTGFTGPRGHFEHRAEQGDIAHQPSLAFVPYLMTGDRFFADEVAFWANFCLIGSFASDYNRKGAQGLLIGNEVRGIGWGLRNLGDAAAYLPDASPMKAYLASKVWNNLVNLDTYGSTFQSGPLQTVFPGRRPEDEISGYRPYMWISLWEQSYVAWAIDRVRQHGPITASHNFANAGAALRDRIARLQLNLFTHAEWPKDHQRQAPYLLAAARWSNGPGSTMSYFQRFSEMAAATFSVPAPTGPDFIRPFEGYYGPEARLMLLICEALGDPGATAALTGLMADVTDQRKMVDDLNTRSGWAIAREGVNPAPPQVAARQVR